MINILVVDDDLKLNKTVCTYLNDCGFHTKGCLGAREAYDEMYNNLYELIISDIMMPEVDGFEFAQTVRQINKRIPTGLLRRCDYRSARLITNNKIKVSCFVQPNCHGGACLVACSFPESKSDCIWDIAYDRQSRCFSMCD